MAGNGSQLRLVPEGEKPDDTTVLAQYNEERLPQVTPRLTRRELEVWRLLVNLRAQRLREEKQKREERPDEAVVVTKHLSRERIARMLRISYLNGSFKMNYAGAANVIATIRKMLGEEAGRPSRLHTVLGCSDCGGTGYWLE